MSKIKDRWKKFDKVTRRIITISTVFSLLLATVSGCWAGFTYFAPSKRVDQIEARLDKRDLKERINFLQEQVYYCTDKFGKDFSKGDAREKKNCRRWVDELEEKYKEYDKYFKG